MAQVTSAQRSRDESVGWDRVQLVQLDRQRRLDGFLVVRVENGVVSGLPAERIFRPGEPMEIVHIHTATGVVAGGLFPTRHHGSTGGKSHDPNTGRRATSMRDRRGPRNTHDYSRTLYRFRTEHKWEKRPNRGRRSPDTQQL